MDETLDKRRKALKVGCVHIREPSPRRLLHPSEVYDGMETDKNHRNLAQPSPHMRIAAATTHSSSVMLIYTRSLPPSDRLTFILKPDFRGSDLRRVRSGELCSDAIPASVDDRSGPGMLEDGCGCHVECPSNSPFPAAGAPGDGIAMEQRLSSLLYEPARPRLELQFHLLLRAVPREG